MYRKVLVANRGEIALRIIRTLREMGIASVAIYSDADRDALFAREADEAYRIGPPPAPESYLNGNEIVRVAAAAGAAAIHPGYGFLAENAAFAQSTRAAGIDFIGPAPETIRLMGDKIAARRVAFEAGVPVVPGTLEPVTSVDDGLAFAAEHSYPVAVKAAGGGGGRGIRIVHSDAEMAESIERASREAATFFKNPEVYLERYFPRPRHIEVQVAGDRSGHVEAWGERDCSTQRRHQKLIEETPAPNLSDRDRESVLAAASALAQTVGYVGVGTAEFLYTRPGEFWFLEMNTRIQVEHTITEAVTGLDLVRESVCLAAGEHATAPPRPRGHAIEARINAEDPARNFQPAPGLITRYHEPGGPGVRVDSGVYQGFTIPGAYDSLVAKLTAHAPTRDEARARLYRALSEYVIEGVPTTIPLHKAIVESSVFREGNMSTSWLDGHLSDFQLAFQPTATSGVESTFADEARAYEVEVNGKRFAVKLLDQTRGRNTRATRPRRARSTALAADENTVVSPMHGTVISIRKGVGDRVNPGEALFVIEAMKMENEVPAPRAGVLAAVKVSEGDTVEVGQELASLEETDRSAAQAAE